MVAQRAGLRPHAAYGTDLGADSSMSCRMEAWIYSTYVKYVIWITLSEPSDRSREHELHCEFNYVELISNLNDSWNSELTIVL